MLMEYILLYDEVMLPEILDIAKEDLYDVIICDSIFGGACFLKQITKIPVVCSLLICDESGTGAKADACGRISSSIGSLLSNIKTYLRKL